MLFDYFTPMKYDHYCELYAADHLILNFHQALEYNLFMAFILHFAAAGWKALLVLRVKKISLKLMIKTFEKYAHWW